VVLEPAMANGWSIIESLHSNRFSRLVPVVVCSVLDERRRGLSLGVTAYLIKPVLPTALLNALNQVLRSPGPDPEDTRITRTSKASPDRRAA
jgi:DNA-binding response OmpR family regulator